LVKTAPHDPFEVIPGEEEHLLGEQTGRLAVVNDGVLDRTDKFLRLLVFEIRARQAAGLAGRRERLRELLARRGWTVKG